MGLLTGQQWWPILPSGGPPPWVVRRSFTDCSYCSKRLEDKVNGESALPSVLTLSDGPFMVCGRCSSKCRSATLAALQSAERDIIEAIQLNPAHHGAGKSLEDIKTVISRLRGGGILWSPRRPDQVPQAPAPKSALKGNFRFWPSFWRNLWNSFFAFSIYSAAISGPLEQWCNYLPSKKAASVRINPPADSLRNCAGPVLPWQGPSLEKLWSGGLGHTNAKAARRARVGAVDGGGVVVVWFSKPLKGRDLHGAE